MSREKKFNTKCSAEFKIAVIMDMRKNHLSHSQTVRKYGSGNLQSEGARYMLHIFLHKSSVQLVWNSTFFNYVFLKTGDELSN